MGPANLHLLFVQFLDRCWYGSVSLKPGINSDCELITYSYVIFQTEYIELMALN